MSTEASPLWPPPGLRLLRPLGEGGYGEVWLAEAPDGGRFALKRLRAATSTAEGEADRVRFRREYLALRRLQAPGVVKAYNQGEIEGRLWFSMEFVEGPPLMKYLQGGRWRGEESPPTPLWFREPDGLAAAGMLARQLFEILAAIHAQGLQHRDLKPDNLLVAPGGRLKLIDFGLARGEKERMADIRLTQDITGSQMVVGTPLYVSPEKIRGLASDARGDLYSAGVLIYQMLTGKLPFDGETVHAVMMAHLTEEPQPPEVWNGALTAAQSKFVLRLLAKEPDGRPSSAGAALAEFDAAFPEIAAAARPVASAPAAFRLLAAPFTGNAAALERGRAAVRAYAAGRGGVFAVSGPSGGGKTRLLDELRALAPEHGLRFYSGTAREDDRAPAALFRELLTRLAERLRGRPHRVGDWLGDHAPLIARHFPEFRTLAGIEPGAPGEPGAERAALRAAIAAILNRIALAGHAVFVFDDLQWADELSLEMVRAFAGRACDPGAPPVLVLLAARETGGKAPALDRLPETATRVALQSLSAGECARLAGAALGMSGPVSEAFAGELQGEAGGNPLHLLEALRAAVETGRLRRDGAGRWRFPTEAGHIPLPAQLASDAIPAPLRARVAALAPEERDALRAAALLGGDFPFVWWRTVSGFDEERLIGLAEDAARDGILTASPDGRYEFTHARWRGVLLEGIPEATERALHARALAALAADPRADDLADRLLRHALGAGDLPAALRHGHRHAARLIALAQSAEARAVLDQLAELHGGVPALPPADRLQHHRLLARLAELTGDAIALRRDAFAGAELARTLKDERAEGECWRRLAGGCLLAGDTAVAEQAGQRALAIANETKDEAAAAWALTRLADTRFARGERGPAEGLLTSALRRAQAAREAPLIGHLLARRARLLLGRGALEEARETLAAAEALGGSAGPEVAADSALGRGELALREGAPGAAELAVAPELERARAAGLTAQVGDCLQLLARLELLRGEAAEARERLTEAQWIAERAGDPRRAAAAALLMARALAATGQSGPAGQALAEALTHAEAAGDGPLAARVRAESALALLARGRAGGATLAAAEALEHAQAAGDPIAEALAGAALAAAGVAGGDAPAPGAFEPARRLAATARDKETELRVEWLRAGALGDATARATVAEAARRHGFAGLVAGAGAG